MKKNKYTQVEEIENLRREVVRLRMNQKINSFFNKNFLKSPLCYEILEQFCIYLEGHGYIDTDWKDEANVIYEFIKEKTR